MAVQEKLKVWLQFARLPLYIFAFIAYSLGVAIAYAFGHFDASVFFLGYICLFLIELNTVFINEYFDYPTDLLNANLGPYTGGSGILVQGKLTLQEVRRGIYAVMVLIVIFGILLVCAAFVPLWSILALAVIGIVFSWGYTAPPLKFCYRGLGEFVVGFTEGTASILAGFVLQTGEWLNPLPWAVSIPPFLSLIACGILGALINYHSDGTVGKRTLPVLFGPRWAAILALCTLVLAAIVGVALWLLQLIPNPVGAAMLIAVPVAVMFGRGVLKIIKRNEYDQPINELMRLSLNYIFIFEVIPLIAFLWG